MRHRQHTSKTVAEVADLYLADLSRLAKPRSADKYGELLDKFIEHVGVKTPIDAVTYEACVLFLNKWSGVSPKTKREYSVATRAQYTSILNQFFQFAYQHDYMETAMKKLVRPRLPRPEDRRVVVVSTNEVRRMFEKCQDWGDEICLGILAYTGARRNAVSMIRWKDVDLAPDPPHGPCGWIRMEEKGGKFTEKPIPYLLREILDRAPEHEAEEYLVPNFRPSQVMRAERKNDVIYKRVKRIAERAGVTAHVHAIRAAFAVFFLESHKGNIKSLQTLLGHESVETTRHYLRGINRQQQMAEVLDLNWNSSALSEGVGAGQVSPLGHAPRQLGLSSVQVGATPSLSALSTGGESTSRRQPDGKLHDGSKPPAPVLSALSERLVDRPLASEPSIVDGEASGHARSGNPPIPRSESASRHEAGHERLAAHHVFPSGPEKAHTGFEPVLLVYESIEAPLVRTGHDFRHETGHYLSVC